MQSIHCKVSCNDQFRRFLFVGTEFSSLFTQVQQLLALDKEFVLKYKDTDGDLITLMSNEELVCALNYSDGDLLRLVVVLKDNVPVTSDPEVPVCGFPCAMHGHFHGGHGWEHNRGGYGHHGSHGHGRHGWEHKHGKHGGHGHHGCHGHGRHGWEHMHGGWGPEMFKAKLTSKRDFFKSQLDELEKVPEKTPGQQQEVLRLQMKLKRIESRLERGWEKKEMKGKHCGKWADKMEKRRQKMEKRMRKKEQKDKCSIQNLSIETQTQITMLRSQIDLLKPAMKEVKIQIKTKKDALKEGKATGGDPHQLIKELLVLKEKRKAQKNEVKPLKQKICELKYASC